MIQEHMHTTALYLRRSLVTADISQIRANFRRANVRPVRGRIFKTKRAKRFNKWSSPQSFTIRDIFLVAKQYLGRAAGVYSSPEKRIGGSSYHAARRAYFMPASVSIRVDYSDTYVLNSRRNLCALPCHPPPLRLRRETTHALVMNIIARVSRKSARRWTTRLKNGATLSTRDFCLDNLLDKLPGCDD